MEPHTESQVPGFVRTFCTPCSFGGVVFALTASSGLLPALERPV